MNPLSLRLTVIAVLLVALAGAGVKCYVKGKQAGAAEVQMKWDAQVQAIEAASQERARQSQRVITKTITKFVTKAAEERVVYRDQTRELEKYVPTNLPVLPSGVRLWHDAVATGMPLTEISAAARADAAPVAVKDLASTVADNYAACRYDQDRLEALQEIARTIAGE